MEQTMTTALATTHDTNEIDLMTLGSMLSKSGYFQDTKDAAQAIVKVLAGRELGIGPISAMTGIYIVKGRVTMSANLMASLIKRSGRYTYAVLTMTDERVELAFKELQGGQWLDIGHSTFTKADAVQAGLWGSSDPWKKTPRNMLFARAMSNGAKWFTPDIFSGPVYTPDELQNEPIAPAYVVDVTTGEVHTPPALPEPIHLASDSQREELRKLSRMLNYSREQVDEIARGMRIDLNALTEDSAQALIDAMTKWAEEDARAATEEPAKPAQNSLQSEWEDIDPPAAKNGALTGVTK